jgi:hypothetical protein
VVQRWVPAIDWVSASGREWAVDVENGWWGCKRGVVGGAAVLAPSLVVVGCSSRLWQTGDGGAAAGVMWHHLWSWWCGYSRRESRFGSKLKKYKKLVKCTHKCVHATRNGGEGRTTSCSLAGIVGASTTGYLWYEVSC